MISITKFFKVLESSGYYQIQIEKAAISLERLNDNSANQNLAVTLFKEIKQAFAVEPKRFELNDLNIKKTQKTLNKLNRLQVRLTNLSNNDKRIKPLVNQVHIWRALHYFWLDQRKLCSLLLNDLDVRELDDWLYHLLSLMISYEEYHLATRSWPILAESEIDNRLSKLRLVINTLKSKAMRLKLTQAQLNLVQIIHNQVPLP